MTRPEPTIHGNCESWSLIVGNKPGGGRFQQGRQPDPAGFKPRPEQSAQQKTAASTVRKPFEMAAAL
jgi:hypothetical protein